MKSRSNSIADDSGSAIIEFLAYGLLLQVGVLIALIQVSGLQAQQLAAESIARHALRAFMISAVQPEISGQQLGQDLGLVTQPKITLDCKPDCSSVGSVIRLNVTIGSANASAVAIQ